MAHLRQSRFQRTGSSRRLTEWSSGPTSAAKQNTQAAGKIMIDTGQQALSSITVIRLRGELGIWIEVATSIDDGFTQYGAGIGIVSVDAFDIGITAVPGPLSDASWGGWMWSHTGSALISRSADESLDSFGSVRIPIDSKAMRKIGINEVVVGVVEFLTEIGTASASFQMGTRMLSKLG